MVMLREMMSLRFPAPWDGFMRKIWQPIVVACVKSYAKNRFLRKSECDRLKGLRTLHSCVLDVGDGDGMGELSTQVLKAGGDEPGYWPWEDYRPIGRC